MKNVLTSWKIVQQHNFWVQCDFITKVDIRQKTSKSIYNSECCFRGSLLNFAESNVQNYSHSISIKEFDSEHLICQNIWKNNNGWERINSLFPCKKWDKVFKSGLSKFCERQPLKNFKRYGHFSWKIIHKMWWRN